MLCPPNCTMHFARLGGYEVDEIPGSEQMAGLGSADIAETLRLISGVRPQAILYGCTSATLTHGVEFDQQLARDIQAATNAVSITAAGALINAIKTLGVNRIGFSSPYIGEVNLQAVAFFDSHGITTVAQSDIGRELDNYGQGELTPAEVVDLAKQVAHPDVDTIVLSCTDMRSVEAIHEIESITGKQVVTSNQAMVFQLCQKLNLVPPACEVGRLFDKL